MWFGILTETSICPRLAVQWAMSTVNHYAPDTHPNSAAAAPHSLRSVAGELSASPIMAALRVISTSLDFRDAPADAGKDSPAVQEFIKVPMGLSAFSLSPMPACCSHGSFSFFFSPPFPCAPGTVFC